MCKTSSIFIGIVRYYFPKQKTKLLHSIILYAEYNMPNYTAKLFIAITFNRNCDLECSVNKFERGKNDIVYVLNIIKSEQFL